MITPPKSHFIHNFFRKDRSPKGRQIHCKNNTLVFDSTQHTDPRKYPPIYRRLGPMTSNLNLLKLCIWLYDQAGEPPLEVLEQTILLEALRGEMLKNIKVPGFSSNYIGRVVAPKLWKNLSRYCGQKVTIRRINLVLQKKYKELSPEEHLDIAAMKVLVEVPEADAGEDSQLPQYPSSACPAVNHHLYNKEAIIAPLRHLLEDSNHNVLFVYGEGGIGKTAVLSDFFQTSGFPVVWCNLAENTRFNDHLQFIRRYWPFDLEPERAIASLCDYLKTNAVTIVFDHWEILFASGELSGQYESRHHQYSQLLRRLIQTPMAGRVVVISSTLAPSMEQLIATEMAIASLEVPKLTHDEAQKILAEYNLRNKGLWLDFVRTYQGNPLTLHILCSAIREWHGGSVEAFQKQKTIIGGRTLGEMLQQILKPINVLERKALNWIMLLQEPVTIVSLQQYFKKEVTFSADIWDVVRSLERRFLLYKQITAEQTIFTLQPSIHRYLMKDFVRQCINEFGKAASLAGSPVPLVLLRDYSLSPHEQFTTRDNVPPVVEVLLKGLQQRCGGGDRLLAILQDLQLAVQGNPEPEEETYLLANLNLLTQAVTLLEKVA